MRYWTYLKDIPNVIHSLIKNNNNFKILNLVSPYISSDIDIMKKITKHKHLIKTYNKEAIYNASYSIYKNKINPITYPIIGVLALFTAGYHGAAIMLHSH